MAASVEQMAGNAAQVADASRRTRSSAEQGKNAVQATMRGMAEIETVVTSAATKVHELGRLGEKIGAVVETIDEIAEQTNLLALNAAIEAARAGEHGRGFAVVADEVRKLAERSSRETRQIAELIADVQSGTREAVAAMAAGAERVAEGSIQADAAGQALEGILSAVADTARQVGEIAEGARQMTSAAANVSSAVERFAAAAEENTAAAEEMSAQAGQVAAGIGDIAAVAEEQSAATEEVSASAEEVSASTEEMSAQAQELAATAEQLGRLVARFNVETTVDTTADASIETIQTAESAAPSLSVVPLKRVA
jgi:methyl-accepting chemotaxis protein